MTSDHRSGTRTATDAGEAETTNDSESFFTERDGVFVGNGIARGPWDPSTCHAGPPTGLIARALEHQINDRRLVRLTVDLHRPIPIDGFTIDAGITRAGRTTAATTAKLVGVDGTVCVVAHGLRIRTAYEPNLPTASIEPLALDDATPGPFPISTGLHDLAQFGRVVEARYPPGEGPDPGPTVVWLKTPRLLEGEEPSAFQHLCPIADCDNALSRNAEPTEVNFINPDLTFTVHREPEGDWLGSASVSHWQDDGIGLAGAVLFDQHGPLGRATQTLLVRRTTRAQDP